jgi:hypothetical protein
MNRGTAAEGEAHYDELEKQLADGPVIDTGGS